MCDGLTNLRHAGRSTDQHNASDIVTFEIRVAKHLSYCNQRALGQVSGRSFKVFSAHGQVDAGLGQLHRKQRALCSRQRLFTDTRSLL